MNKANIAILSETWFQKGDAQLRSLLENISLKDEIKFVRKDRDKRGGGVSIAYNAALGDFKKLGLDCLKRKKWEILCATGKLRGVKKHHIIIAAYLPPSYNREQNSDFMDCLTSVLVEAKTKVPDSWLTLGGDWNGRPLQQITDSFADIQVVQMGPTRKDATLDIILST